MIAESHVATTGARLVGASLGRTAIVTAMKAIYTQFL